MEIKGKLREDIINGNAILFLGAGVGIAAGLHGAKDLANYLFQETMHDQKFEKNRDNLEKLVAMIDKDPHFTREWTYGKLKEYFLDDNNYINLYLHTKLLENGWGAIFTTNYDLTIEKASLKILEKKWRLLPISNYRDKELICSREPGKLKYFKIHGCIDELDRHRENCAPLVITRSDFINSIKHNYIFLDELGRYSLDSSVIFIGFNVHRTENNHILSSVIELHEDITRNIRKTPYRPFAVIPNVSDDNKDDLEEIGINLIEGTFEEFVNAIIEIKKNKKIIFQDKFQDNIYIKTSTRKISISRSELHEYNKQFYFYYESFFREQKDKFESLSIERKMDAWKSQPSYSFIYGGNWSRRTIFTKAYEIARKLISEVAEKEASRIFIISGKRACGKTVFAHQLAYELHKTNNNPIIFLNPDSNYGYFTKDNEEHIISGWNYRVIDKFLSLFHEKESYSHELTPIIIADHVSIRQNAIDILIKNLNNHGKYSVIILTLNDDEANKIENEVCESDYVNIIQSYKYKKITLNHQLDDFEIDNLFSVISKDFYYLSEKKDFLLSKAKDDKEANRDILLILYQWFDKRFRRIEEIIIEESEKIKSSHHLMNLYLSVSAFYRYGIKPPIKACIDSLEIDSSTYDSLKDNHLFKSLITLSMRDEDNEYSEYAFSRHPEYSRKIFEHLCPEKDKQNSIIIVVLENCKDRDLIFVRSFFNYLYSVDKTYAVADIQSFKEATEVNKYLRTDSVLDHQFGAYLVRENTELDSARFYLDRAANNDPENPTILHSIGNLHYKKFKNYINEKDENKAVEYYNLAKDSFERIRTISRIPDEHSYFTDISLTRYRRDHSFLMDNKKKIELSAEADCLFFQALKVVPNENQRYLRRCTAGKKFIDIDDESKKILMDKIISGNASSTLIQYYANDLLENPKRKNWLRLKELVAKYINTNDINILIYISIISKRAFIKSAEDRFERIRVHFDRLIRYQDQKIDFVLLSEYLKLLIIDAFVLEKYTFIIQVMADIKKIYIRSFPKFLKDEYILEKKYYQFDESDEEKLKNFFHEHSMDFEIGKNTQFFERIINLPPLEEPYVKIEIDPITRFWVRAVRKEIATSSRRPQLRFKIKYGFDGLKATGFIG